MGQVKGQNLDPTIKNVHKEHRDLSFRTSFIAKYQVIYLLAGRWGLLMLYLKLGNFTELKVIFYIINGILKNSTREKVTTRCLHVSVPKSRTL